MPDLPPEVEQQLAGMSDVDWDVLVARLRAPDMAEEFRTAASKYVDGDRLETICKVANISQFTGEDGRIDEAKVERSLRAVFGIPAGSQWQNYGQFTQAPYQPGPGERGHAEAQKRFGGQPQPSTTGRGGREEAQRRFKNGTQQ